MVDSLQAPKMKTETICLYSHFRLTWDKASLITLGSEWLSKDFAPAPDLIPRVSDLCTVCILYSKISTDPGLLKIRHSHRFVALVIQFLIPPVNSISLILTHGASEESGSLRGLSSLASGGGKMRDPCNEVGQLRNSRQNLNASMRLL